MNAAEDKKEAVRKARAHLAKSPLYLDTETTGVRSTSEIVEICIIDHDGSVLLDTLVKPHGLITPDAQRIHGITNTVVKDAPRWEQIWPEVEQILAGRHVGIFNADFDLRLMQQSHKASGLNWQPIGANAFCIMHLYAQFYGEWDQQRQAYRWQSLEKAGRRCSISLPNAHRARADTLLTREVLSYMAAHEL
ncbi:MAG: 3'-5' exonuclease [Chloroflexota bacterium]